MTRLDRARAKLAKTDYDALYVTSEVNQRYMTDFAFTDGTVLITHEKSYVITDFRYIEAAKANVVGDYEIVTNRSGDFLLELCRKNHVKTLAFEEDSMSYARYKSLSAKLSGVTLCGVGGFVEELRLYKEPAEVEKIVAAQRIAERAFSELVPEIKRGMLETEIAAELEYKMRKLGAEDKSFDTIAVSGSASALPHGVPRRRPIENGFFTFDFGAVVGGYHSDMTRTIVIGKADDEMKRLYNTVLEAQLAAETVITEGYRNCDADTTARDIIENAGYHGCFGHSLGHGVGLEIHESPRLSQNTGDMTLAAGQIVTVEPGIYIEGKYGCRIEDMMLITEGGARILTDCPKELIELDI